MTRLAPLAVRLAALWILAGGVAKLLVGTPAHLPEPVRNFPFDPDLNLRVFIAIELGVGFLGLLLPRFGWPLVTGTILVFLAVLGQLLAAGAESCGCFGSKFPVAPWQMAAADGTLLLLLLATRPWKIPGGAGEARRFFAWVPLAAVGAAAPFVWIERTDSADRAAAELAAAGAGAEDGTTAWSRPPRDRWPRYIAFDTTSWVGRTAAAIPTLSTWFDTSLWMPDCTGILWRRDCDHCAEHLRELALADDGSVVYVMIELPPTSAEADPVVDMRPNVLPDYDLAYPDGIDYIVETPVEFGVKGGVVWSVQEGPRE